MKGKEYDYFLGYKHGCDDDFWFVREYRNYYDRV